MENQIKTILLLGVLSLLVVFVGGVLGGRGGMMMAFIISLAMNGAAYFFSDKMALAASGAQELKREQAPQIYAMVEDLTRKANIPMPKLFITPEMQANAFATGRDPQHASVAVTEGLLRVLNPEEIKAVLAHELGHIKNRDILIASIAAVIASTVGYLAQMSMFSAFSGDREEGSNPIMGIAILLLAPIAGTIVQMAISRSREYLADDAAKQMMGSGQPLASALRSIHASVSGEPMHGLNPAYSSMYIANPFGGVGGGLVNLFSTHPPVEERIKRLLN